MHRFYINKLNGMAEQNRLSKYVKAMRRQYGLTQEDLSAKSGVGLRFIRDLEQGKATLRTDKVNCVLNLFGAELGVVSLNDGHSLSVEDSSL